MLQEGNLAPDFTLTNDSGESFTLSNHKGKWIIIYFYPKDNTPGCTKEACEFNLLRADLEKFNAIVVGISKDNIDSHRNFKLKYDLEFNLLSDINADVCRLYESYKPKVMFGREYLGVERQTYLINPEGNIVKIWRKVKVNGHVDEVIETLKLNHSL